jgi:hypothetical protein
MKTKSECRRQQCADNELLLRALLLKHARLDCDGYREPIFWVVVYGNGMHRATFDSTGIPILTDDARAALKRCLGETT